jgi:hypothetical protein
MNHIPQEHIMRNSSLVNLLARIEDSALRKQIVKALERETVLSTQFVENKREWKDGPWHDETDGGIWSDKATGYAVMIRRNGLGAFCGYVGVPNSHPFYGRHVTYNLSDPLMNCDVHGGITFNGPMKCKEMEDLWVFGFDCNHTGDSAPKDTYAFGTYRDIEYVKSEVQGLARFLYEHRNEVVP